MNSLYADGFNLICGLADAKIDILSINPILNEKGVVQSEDRLVQQRIIMSMPLIKDFSSKLNELVTQYESTFGTIQDLNSLKEIAQNNGR